MGELRFFMSIAALAAASWIGWEANGWRLDAKNQAEALDRAKQHLKAMERRDDLAARLSAKNDFHLKKLGEKTDETNRLRACLDDGSCGLRIVPETGTCPGVPESSSGSGVDSGAGAGPSSDFERAYLAHREAINASTAKLEACQEQLKARSDP